MFHSVIITILVSLAISIDGHGRLMKPTSRSSIWRVAEFQSFNAPINPVDDALFCGALLQQEGVNGNCGVCGDPSIEPKPRANELAGYFDKGIITGNYTKGQVIEVDVEVTIGHLGYMQWRLCDHPQDGETQDCFNEHLLQRADGKGSKVHVTSEFYTSKWYKTQLVLPAGVTCERCVIQWHYRAGDNFGMCGFGSYQRGCGLQQAFRGCADVTIN